MGFDGAGRRAGARLAQPAERAVRAARVGRAVSREPARRRACAGCCRTRIAEQQRGRPDAAITGKALQVRRRVQTTPASDGSRDTRLRPDTYEEIRTL